MAIQSLSCLSLRSGINNIYFKTFVSLILVVFIFLINVGLKASADAIDPTPMTFYQPDNSTFLARAIGDSTHIGLTIVNGSYAIVKGDDGYWHYVDATGKTSIRVNSGNPDPTYMKGYFSLSNVQSTDVTIESFNNFDPITPAQGDINLLVIMVNFNDNTIPYTKQQYQDVLFTANPPSSNIVPYGSIHDYFVETSYGKININGDIYDGITLNNPLSYYQSHPDQIATDAIAIAAQEYQIDWAKYDTHPSNGKIDNIIFIYAAPAFVYNRNTNTFDPVIRPYQDGQTLHQIPGTSYIMQNYIIAPAFQNDYAGICRVGEYAHEIAHAFGLPDLYTYNYNPAGSWDLMGYGEWNDYNYQGGGSSPAHLSAWSKATLGIISPTQIAQDTMAFSLSPAENNQNSMYQILDNTGGYNFWDPNAQHRGEFFMVEYRRQIGFDQSLPQNGSLIWHINEGQPIPVQLEISSADNNPDHGAWTNSNTIGFTPYTNPNSNLYDGPPSYVSITSISSVPSNNVDPMSFDVRLPHSYTITLHPSWNLISVPLELFDNSIEHFFPDNVKSQIVVVWAWDESRQDWTIYTQYTDDYFYIYYPHFTSIRTDRGFWVYYDSTTSTSFNIYGLKPVQDTVSYDSLSGEWTIVGYPSMTTCPPSNLYSNAEVVWGWDESRQDWTIYTRYTDDYFYQHYPHIINLEPGYGYWVYKSTGILSLDDNGSTDTPPEIPYVDLNASIISYNIPSSMVAGQSYTATVTMNNTGNAIWNSTVKIRLGGVGGDQGDAARFGPTLLNITDGVNVAPGQSYTWSFTMTAPTQLGTYTPQYQMTYNDSYWFGEVVSKSITVIMPPVANFWASPTTVNVGQTVMFNDASTNLPTVWQWNGDCSFENSQFWLAGNSPPNDVCAVDSTHVYSGIHALHCKRTNNWDTAVFDGQNALAVTPETTYFLSVKVWSASQVNGIRLGGAFVDANGNSLGWRLIEGNVNSPNSWADFNGTITAPANSAKLILHCGLSSGTSECWFDNLTCSNVRWQWNFGDGTQNSSLQNPTHIYNTSGNYTVTLTTSNTAGSSTLQRTSYISVAASLYVFSRSSNAYNSTGTSFGINVPRVDKNGLFLEESTTNMLTVNQADIESGTTGFGTYATTASSDTSYKWSGTHGLKITSTGESPDSFAYVGGDAGAMRLGMVAGNTYTMSAMEYVQASTGLTPDGVPRGLRIVGYYKLNGTYHEVWGNAPTATGVFQKVNCTMTIPSGATEAFFRLYNGFKTSSKSTWYDGIQLEQKSYATSWMPGGYTRSGDIFTGPSSALSPTQGTIEMRLYVDQSIHNTANPNWDIPFSIVHIVSPNSKNDQISLRRWPNSQTWGFILSNSAGSDQILTTTITNTGWHDFALTWNNSSGASFYLDGNLVQSSTDTVHLPSRFGYASDNMNFSLAWASIVFQHDSYVRDLRISNRARTAVEIQADRQSSRPLLIDANTTWYNDFASQ